MAQRTDEARTASEKHRTHPIADIVRRADVYQRAHAALEQRGDVKLRGEAPVVEVLPERLVHGRRAVAEVSSTGRVDAEELLRGVAAQEVADIPVQQ